MSASILQNISYRDINTTHSQPSEFCQRNSGNRYDGECRDSLIFLQNCLSFNDTSDSDVYIAEGLDTAELDEQIANFKAGLRFISATPECEDLALPFFCLYLFGLCDASGKLHQPSRDECIHISTDICAVEWATAIDLLPENTLPQCESFQADNPICSSKYGCLYTYSGIPL